MSTSLTAEGGAVRRRLAFYRAQGRIAVLDAQDGQITGQRGQPTGEFVVPVVTLPGYGPQAEWRRTCPNSTAGLRTSGDLRVRSRRTHPEGAGDCNESMTKFQSDKKTPQAAFSN
ncbi:hypothetical protein ACFQ60_46760 [Streptomyces zhihengii]